MEDFSTGKRDIGKGVAKNLGEQNKFYFKLKWNKNSFKLINAYYMNI